MKNKCQGVSVLVLAGLFLVLVCPEVSWAADVDTGRFMQGFQNMMSGVFQIPYQVVNSTLTQPFPFGVVEGVITGTIKTVTQVIGGAFDMGAAAAPLAKYAWIAAL